MVEQRPLATRRRQIPRWLRGGAWASPSGSAVRVSLENNSGTRAEVYLTKKQARELLADLERVLRP